MEMGNGILDHNLAVSIACLRGDVEPCNMFREGKVSRRVSRPKIWSKRFQKYILECDSCDCSEDRLGGKVAGAEVGGRKCQNFKGEAFGFDHYETGEGEADHGKPIVEGWLDVRSNFRLGRISMVRMFKRASHLFLSGQASSYARL